MIKVLSNTDGSIKEGSLKDLKTKKIVWVDAFSPNRAELELIAEFSGIPHSSLQEHLVPYERPTTFEFKDYSMIVFGCPTKDHFKPSTVAIYILKNNNVITIRKKDIEGITRFQNHLIETQSRLFDSADKIIRVMFDQIIADYYTAFDKLQESAEAIEARVFIAPDKRMMEELFRIKKHLLHYHKALIADREILSQVQKQYLSKLSHKELYEFNDIYNDIVQLIDSEEMLRDIITGIVDIYMSSVSNQMNIVIKKLTVAASYVLIPTLIASIYGMNFGNMPEISWKWGYPFALGLMVLSIVAMHFYFKKSNWL